MTEFDVKLYTRHGCCLCDQAKTLLERHGLQVQEIDIDQEDRLTQLYGNHVPVVFIDGKERFRGRVDERLLNRILRSAIPDKPDAQR